MPRAPCQGVVSCSRFIFRMRPPPIALTRLRQTSMQGCKIRIDDSWQKGANPGTSQPFPLAPNPGQPRGPSQTPHQRVPESQFKRLSAARLPEKQLTPTLDRGVANGSRHLGQGRNGIGHFSQQTAKFSAFQRRAQTGNHCEYRQYLAFETPLVQTSSVGWHIQGMENAHQKISEQLGRPLGQCLRIPRPTGQSFSE